MSPVAIAQDSRGEADQAKQKQATASDNNARADRKSQVKSGRNSSGKTEKSGSAAQTKTAVASNRGKPMDEKAVLEFVDAHQPELGKLLNFMKRRQPAQYEQAMRDMTRSANRLRQLETRDPELYALELELWQIQSRLRLLAAELAVGRQGSERGAAEKRLRSLVEQEIQVRTKRLEIQKKRAQAQVKRLGAQLDEYRAHPNELAEKELKTWQNQIKRQMSESKKKQAESKAKVSN